MTLLFCTISFNCYSQNIIYKGSKKYSATESWQFKRVNDFGYLDVQVAKSENGGFLRLEVDASENLFYIGGNIYVFLEDGTMLTCTDKKIKDHVDGKCIVLYFFTNAEMEKLAELDIMKIRFTIEAKSGVWGSESGNYTAENKKAKSLSSLFEKKEEKEYFDTSEAITLLLNN